MLRMSLMLAGFVYACCVVPTAQAQEAPTHTKDTLADVKKNVESGKAVIVDVREQNEWDAGHVKGAILLPRSKLTVDSGKSVIVVTHDYRILPFADRILHMENGKVEERAARGYAITG